MLLVLYNHECFHSLFIGVYTLTHVSCMLLAARQRGAPPGGGEWSRESGRPSTEAQSVRQRQVETRSHATSHGGTERVQQLCEVAHSDAWRRNGCLVIGESTIRLPVNLSIIVVLVITNNVFQLEIGPGFV